MTSTLNRFLREHLRPETYSFLRYGLPRRLVGMVRPLHPQARLLTGEDRNGFVSALERIDLARTTELCRVMARFGSDKSTGHTYSSLYVALLGRSREQVARVFELGLGTTNLSIPSNMGPAGRPGGSLRAWREYFPKADVYGADIDANVLFREERIETYQCDQTNAASIAAMWNRIPAELSFDVIIDDGLHEFHANEQFLLASIGRLDPRGLYVVEDVDTSAFGRWEEMFARLPPPLKGLEGYLVQLGPTSTHPNDNNLILIRRNRPSAN